MHHSIHFKNLEDYKNYRGDIDFWYPYMQHVADKHHLSLMPQNEIRPGENPTYPVFISGEIVFKFFGCFNHYTVAFENERAAHQVLILDTTILAPHIKAEGTVFDDDSWFYLVSTKISGAPLTSQNLSQADKSNLAYALGQQLQKIHRLPVPETLRYDFWHKLDLEAAAGKSILPKHLVLQIPEYMQDVEFDSPCFVNGDLVPQHIFVENKKLSGLIDWGDATIFDKHYELGKLMDSFDWNKDLLRVMLDGADWIVKSDFETQALSMSLYRQAMGLVQHTSFDVFYKLPALYPLEDIKTLAELAHVLFDVK